MSGQDIRLVDFIAQAKKRYPGNRYSHAGEKPRPGRSLQGEEDEEGEDEILSAMAQLV